MQKEKETFMSWAESIRISSGGNLSQFVLDTPAGIFIDLDAGEFWGLWILFPDHDGVLTDLDWVYPVMEKGYNAEVASDALTAIHVTQQYLGIREQSFPA